MKRFNTLTEWLTALEAISPEAKIALGLSRVKAVANTLNLLAPKAKVITVAGTNGKGSTVATLESLLLSHNKTVATLTSPHLVKYNERIKLKGIEATDAQIIESFEAIDEVASKAKLTYFEWMVVAALWLFNQHNMDYWLLEVGLGGRLDATNIVDADIAIVTNIDFDHTALLGNSREEIGYEKAGIFRKNQIVFCGDFNPPNTVLEQAMVNQTEFYQIGSDYQFKRRANDWTWQGEDENAPLSQLPYNGLHLNNISTALACFQKLNIPATRQSVSQALQQISIKGRAQWLKSEPPILIDVAHNGQSIANLSEKLSQLSKSCLLVFSMLKSKDIDATINQLKPFVEKWYIAAVDPDRCFSSSEIAAELFAQGVKEFQQFEAIDIAFKQALTDAKSEQAVVVTGSFLTVAGVMPQLEKLALI